MADTPQTEDPKKIPVSAVNFTINRPLPGNQITVTVHQPVGETVTVEIHTLCGPFMRTESGTVTPQGSVTFTVDPNCNYIVKVISDNAARYRLSPTPNFVFPIPIALALPERNLEQNRIRFHGIVYGLANGDVNVDAYAIEEPWSEIFYPASKTAVAVTATYTGYFDAHVDMQKGYNYDHLFVVISGYFRGQKFNFSL